MRLGLTTLIYGLLFVSCGSSLKDQGKRAESVHFEQMPFSRTGHEALLPNNSNVDPLTMTADGSPVIIVIGGNNSCKSLKFWRRKSVFNSSMINNFLQEYNQSELKNRISPEHVILGCLTMGAKNVFYTTLDRANRGFEEIETTPEELPVLLSAALPSNQPLIFVGHSYGAWLTMHLALHFAPSHVIRALFTLDPISPLTCKVFDREGCHDAPLDIDEGMRTQIQLGSDHWYNYFCDASDDHKLPLVHSGNIAHAEINRALPSRHSQIMDQPVVWQDFKALVLGFENVP